MNWLDFVLLAIMVVTAIVGIFKGFVKQVIGLVAVVAGLVLASFYYERAASIFESFVHNRLLSNFLGFLLLFVAVLVAGAVVGHLLHKAMIGPLALVNRLFGALFGFIKAVLICGIIVFALVSFEIAKPALETSVLAPACLGVTRAVINLIPQDLRAKFNSSYKRIRESGGNMDKKSSELNLHQRMELIVKDMVDKEINLKDALREFEKIFFEQTARKHEGNQTKMAKSLGIHRNTLHNRAKLLKIRKKY